MVKLFDNVKIIDASGYTATADIGIYSSTKKTFTLQNNVKVKDKSDYTALAKIGIYDLNKKTLPCLMMFESIKAAMLLQHLRLFISNKKTNSDFMMTSR